MADIEDCPGFGTFGADVKAARRAKRVPHKVIAEKINTDWYYLANIESGGAIPSLPVAVQLIETYGLPMERYFNLEVAREENELRQRVSHKLRLCPEEYPLIIKDAIDSIMLIEKPKKNETKDV